ncbi:MarR family winged helix-turn-helix transcriptional regulator [Kineococcus sp. SYSU DK002]|uniref:MarR family winged helix-turn-helix transcriptional regulator n=1 Tax=Kineococcus sp. SYSU DK002 TaxID=3383123 RepID=UPI003D7C3D94
MSTYRPRDTPRARLEREIVDELRDLVGVSERIVDAFAARHGLHPTDLQALIHVMRREIAGDPLTAGELAGLLDVTTGAATGVVDRLERHGHLRRDRGDTDRRKVYLRYADPGMELAREFFAPLARRSDAVLAQFDDAELDVVHRFLTGMGRAFTERHREL